MGQELVNLNEIGIKQEDSKALAELTKAGDYLPALRINGSSSNIVKEGKIPMGHWGLHFTADKFVDLDTQVDVLIIAYRPRASIFAAGEAPVSFFNPDEANFIHILEQSKAGVQSYAAGLEYLVYIPSIKEYGLFLCGNKTLRRESSNVKALVGKAATLKIKLITSGGNSWHGCETLSCEAPFDVPSGEEIKEVYDSKFINPKDSEVSLVGETEERAR